MIRRELDDCLYCLIYQHMRTMQLVLLANNFETKQ